MRRFVSIRASFWLVLLLGAGCQRESAVPAASERPALPEPVAKAAGSATLPSSSSAHGQVAEDWDVAYLGEHRVGYFRTLSDRIERAGTTLIHVRQTGRISLERFGQPMTMEFETDSFEEPDGRLIEIGTRIKMANTELRTTGKLESDGRFHLVVHTTGKTEKFAIDWSDKVLGPYAHERVLKEEPLQVGQKRSFETFLPPPYNSIAVTTLDAVRQESTPLLDRSRRELLLIEQTTPDVPKTSWWVDEGGGVVKGMIPFGELSMITYRVPREEALAGPLDPTVDIGHQTLVRPDRPIPDAHQTRSVRYRLELADAEAAGAIPEADYQAIERRDGHSLTLEVRRRTPAADSALGEPPGDEFLSPNGFVQSDDPGIAGTAQQVVAGETRPWPRVQRLESWVYRNIDRKDFSIGFADATEVFHSRQGDCTEHAVLLTAMCRAVGVPARVAMGLVYLGGRTEPQFGYHMWTEVHIDGQWYAVDGTLGQGGIGGGHIKIADGSLKGANALSTLLPIFKVIGKLRIHVEKVEH